MLVLININGKMKVKLQKHKPDRTAISIRLFSSELAHDPYLLKKANTKIEYKNVETSVAFEEYTLKKKKLETVSNLSQMEKEIET